MTRTLLIAAALATTLGAATVGGAAPALADHDGCYNCGQGYGYNDNDWRYNPPNQQRWADYRPDWRHRMLSPEAGEDALRRQGFRHIDFVGRDGRDGDVYRYKADDPRGRNVRVALNAHSGQIIDVQRR
jgi:hypothetical protein